MENVNSFSGGMKNGIDPTIFPQDSVLVMRNGHIFSQDENRYVVTNIKSPAQAFTLRSGYWPIGSAEFNDDLYIMSFNGTNIEIGRYGLYEGIYTYKALHTLQTDGGLMDFNILASKIGYVTCEQVEMFARKSFDDTVNLYICDGLNANIVINSGLIYQDTTDNPLVPSEVNMFKSVSNIPNVIGEVIDGGYLKPGNYFIAIRQTTSDLNSTGFCSQVGPFCISGDNKGLLDKNSIRTERSIKLSLSNLDEDYKYIEVALIRYFGENGAISVDMNIITRKFINPGTIILTGMESTVSITAEELLMNSIEKDMCMTHVQHENRYFGANWKNKDNDQHHHLIEIARRIIPHFSIKNEGTDEEMIAIAKTRNYSNLNAMDEMKYKAGEIYPFAVSFVINGKYGTDAFPICGYDSNLVSYGQVRTSIDNYQGNQGLYRFPFDSLTDIYTDGSARRRQHYAMMGVTFDTTLAVQYILDNDVDIDITSMTIMQGERVRNFISQGVVLPMIDRIVVHPEKYSQYVLLNGYKGYADQIIALGDGAQRTFFPFMIKGVQSASSVKENDVLNRDKFQFPVHAFRGRGFDNNEIWGAHELWGYASAFFNQENYGHGIVVGENDSIKHNNGFERVFYHEDADLASVDGDEAIIASNMMTQADHFAFFSPDEMHEHRNFNGFLRTLYSINNSTGYQKSNVMKRPVILSWPNIRVSDEVKFNSYDKPFLYLLSTDTVTQSNFTDSQLCCRAVEMTYVPEDLIIPDDNGCISRMKSIFEIFGDFTQEGYNGSYIQNNVVGKTRRQLTDAGLMLNRLMFKEESQTEGAELIVPSWDGSDCIPFQGWRWNNEPNCSLPLIMTNVSMKSAPYQAFQSPNVVDGLTVFSDYVCEKYLYDPDAVDVYDHFLNQFNVYMEKYHPVANIVTPLIPTSVTVYKGDIYGQVVTFRLNRFSHEAGNNAKAADWRHGQLVTSYLESTKNHNLRSTTDDDMFWPYAGEVGYSLLDFAYASNVARMGKESWVYNEGNHELAGLLCKYGVDINIPVQSEKNPNRVYFSNKHIIGSYEDAYRSIPSQQYRDINFEYGDIIKLVSFGGELFAIMENGIVQMYTNNKTAAVDDSSSIIIGDPEVLYEETRPLFDAGTQNKESVVIGDNGFFCIDWKNRKILYTSKKVSDKGSVFFSTEDLCLTKSLNTFFYDMLATAHPDHQIYLHQALNGDVNGKFLGIVSGFNMNKHEAYFTFHFTKSDGTQVSDTLVFNEMEGKFTGYYDYKANNYMQYGNEVLMFNKYNAGTLITLLAGTDIPGMIPTQLPDGDKVYNTNAYPTVWRQEACDKRNNFFKVVGNRNSNPFKIVFYVNGMSEQNNLSNYEKEFLINHIFASDNLLKTDADIPTFLRNITWETEYQSSSTDINADQNAFWKTPEYKEHTWRVPVDVQSSASDGPQGTDSFNTFEPGSTLRGPWMKVTITYTGEDKIFIKNVVTKFIISKS